MSGYKPRFSKIEKLTDDTPFLGTTAKKFGEIFTDGFERSLAKRDAQTGRNTSQEQSDMQSEQGSPEQGSVESEDGNNKDMKSAP